MANPGHRSIWLEHEMIVDGVLFKESKGLAKTLNDEGVEESHLIHIRVIGERYYTAKQTINGGEELIETDLDVVDLENFKNEWEEKWNPSIREDEPWILNRVEALLGEKVEIRLLNAVYWVENPIKLNLRF